MGDQGRCPICGRCSICRPDQIGEMLNRVHVCNRDKRRRFTGDGSTNRFLCGHYIGDELPDNKCSLCGEKISMVLSYRRDHVASTVGNGNSMAGGATAYGVSGIFAAEDEDELESKVSSSFAASGKHARRKRVLDGNGRRRQRRN